MRIKKKKNRGEKERKNEDEYIKKLRKRNETKQIEQRISVN